MPARSASSMVFDDGHNTNVARSRIAARLRSNTRTPWRVKWSGR